MEHCNILTWSDLRIDEGKRWGRETESAHSGAETCTHREHGADEEAAAVVALGEVLEIGLEAMHLVCHVCVGFLKGLFGVLVGRGVLFGRHLGLRGSTSQSMGYGERSVSQQEGRRKGVHVICCSQQDLHMQCLAAGVLIHTWSARVRA